MQAARDVGLALVGAATAAGAYGPGQEQTPARLRVAGLVEALTAAAPRVDDRGDTAMTGFRDDPGRPDAQNVPAVREVAEAVADRLLPPLAAGSAALVVGGDCTVELGVVAAALTAVGRGRVGLVYVDLDADLNVPATADEGRLDWMGVAHLLDVDGCVRELADLGPRRPMLAPQDVVLVGVANTTEAERAMVGRLGLRLESADEVRRDLDAVLARIERWVSGVDLLLVHVDVDVLDADDRLLAESTRRGAGGLKASVLLDLVVGLCRLPAARVLTVTEANLDHAPDPREAAAWLIAMLVAAVTA